MDRIIWTSDKLRRDWDKFIQFTQQIANRLAQAYPRYESEHGGLHKSQRYMTRLGLELRAYRKTGNREHLLNISAYAYLESQAPENARFHYDQSAGSVTRGKV